MTISLSFLVISSCDSNRQTWKNVSDFLQSDTLSISQIKAKISLVALDEIVRVDSIDTIKQVKKFFYRLSRQKNYKVKKEKDFVYVIFNPNDKIARGPTIVIVKDKREWFIERIQFGL